MRVTAVAIAFLVILGIFVWVMTDAALPSNSAMTKLRLERIKQVFNAQAARTGVVPSSLSELKAEDGKALVVEDYWGRAIRFVRGEGDSRVVAVESLGADGKVGGSGEDRDLRVEWTVDLGSGSSTQTTTEPVVVPATQP